MQPGTHCQTRPRCWSRAGHRTPEAHPDPAHSNEPCRASHSTRRSPVPAVQRDDRCTPMHPSQNNRRFGEPVPASEPRFGVAAVTMAFAISAGGEIGIGFEQERCDSGDMRRRHRGSTQHPTVAVAVFDADGCSPPARRDRARCRNSKTTPARRTASVAPTVMASATRAGEVVEAARFWLPAATT